MSLTNNINRKNSLTHNWHVSHKEAPSCTSLSAGFTLEAAVTLPFFVGFMVCILFFFCIIQVQIKVEQALNHTGREISAYACLETTDFQVVNPETELVMAKGILLSHLQKESELMSYVQGNAMGVSLLTSDLEGDYVRLNASYRIQLPLGLFGIHNFPMQQTVKIRKWTGYQAEGENGEWVYITPTGTVYHITKSCPYLDLSIHAAAAAEISVQRNKNGAKYKPCSACKGEAAIVYITDYGTKYHKDINCSGLKRTVYRIKKSETEGRKTCSKCGGTA